MLPILHFLARWGYLGLFFGAFLAATVVPFSPDALLIGLLAAGGNPYLCFFSATIGNWLGSLTTYALGWVGKWEWIEKWFKVKEETLERQRKSIDKYGALLAFFVWMPFLGDLFALALGFYKVRPVKCTVFILIGKAARFAFWMLLFYFFTAE